MWTMVLLLVGVVAAAWLVIRRAWEKKEGLIAFMAENPSR